MKVYEPSELERKHFTDQDNEIRTTDMPERFQVNITFSGSPHIFLTSPNAAIRLADDANYCNHDTLR